MEGFAMTTVAILAENDPAGTKYRAIAGARQSVGSTPGQALDAIAASLPESESGTLVVVQQFRPDGFFTAPQRQRLDDLMSRWRAARDRGNALPEAERAELEALIDGELRAAVARAVAIAQEQPE
jgi:hypothetical protein